MDDLNKKIETKKSSIYLSLLKTKRAKIGDSAPSRYFTKISQTIGITQLIAPNHHIKMQFKSVMIAIH